MGAQTTVSNEQGQYRFPTLPPGTYRLEYQLPGFSTVVRDQIVVQITFTATVNVQLQVASLNETVTVTGASPVVDTQNTQIQTNFTQEMIKSLPNARDIWALIAVAPGTTMSSFDVGGSRAGTQTGYSAYGRGDQVRVQVDGANSTEDTGGTGYFNYGAFEEVSIGTDSNDASMPTPGVQINAVVKSGGNQFRGDLYVDFQDAKMQGQNVSDEQRQKGLGEGTRITRYYDPNLGIGGPIKRDKVWYFVSLRKQYSGSNIGGFPVEDPGTFEFQSQLENITEKTTYQLSQNNKLSQFMELSRKLQPSRDASSTRYQDAVYKQESISSYGTVEWNSVVSPAFFMNTRFSSWGYNWPNYAYGPDGNLGENVQPRRTERLTGNVTGGAREDKTYRRRFQIDWSGTYFKDEFLSSNHTIRVGFTSEQETQRDLDNGFVDEYTAMYDSASGQGDFFRPWRVQIGNTPREATDNLRHHGRVYPGPDRGQSQAHAQRRLPVGLLPRLLPGPGDSRSAFPRFLLRRRAAAERLQHPGVVPRLQRARPRCGAEVPGRVCAALRCGIRPRRRRQDGAEGQLGPLQVEPGPAGLRQPDPEPDCHVRMARLPQRRRDAHCVRRRTTRRRAFRCE